MIPQLVVNSGMNHINIIHKSNPTVIAVKYSKYLLKVVLNTLTIEIITIIHKEIIIFHNNVKQKGEENISIKINYNICNWVAVYL